MMSVLLLQVGEPVGIMALNQSMSEFYSRSPLLFGMGTRECAMLDPTLQVLLPLFILCFCYNAHLASWLCEQLKHSVKAEAAGVEHCVVLILI